MGIISFVRFYLHIREVVSGVKHGAICCEKSSITTPLCMWVYFCLLFCLFICVLTDRTTPRSLSTRGLVRKGKLVVFLDPVELDCRREKIEIEAMLHCSYVFVWCKFLRQTHPKPGLLQLVWLPLSHLVRSWKSYQGTETSSSYSVLEYNFDINIL